MPQYNLLTVEEVAAILRISATTVRELILRGELAAIKAGRAYRIKQSDVDAFLQTTPTSPQVKETE